MTSLLFLGCGAAELPDTEATLDTSGTGDDETSEISQAQTVQGVIVEMATSRSGTRMYQRECDVTWSGRGACSGWITHDLSDEVPSDALYNGSPAQSAFASVAAYTFTNATGSRIQWSLMSPNGSTGYTQNCTLGSNGLSSGDCGVWSTVNAAALVPGVSGFKFVSSFYYSANNPSGVWTNYYTQSLSTMDGTGTYGRNCQQNWYAPTGVDWNSCGGWYYVPSNTIDPSRPWLNIISNNLIQYDINGRSTLEQTLLATDGTVLRRHCDPYQLRWYENCPFSSLGVFPLSDAATLSIAYAKGKKRERPYPYKVRCHKVCNAATVGYVSGEGTSCEGAKQAANAKVEQGCYKRHCKEVAGYPYCR